MMSTSRSATAPYSAGENAGATGFGLTDLGLCVMALIWGINYSVVKGGIERLSPLTFNGLRVALAAIVLAGIAATVRAALPSRRDIVALLALGLLGNGLYQLMFILGLSRTRAGVAALVIAAGPTWIAVLSHMFGIETVGRRGWAAIALQLAGVACVVRSAGGAETSGSALWGAVMIAVGSIMWALFSVLLVPYTKRVHPLHLSAFTAASGALFLLVIGFPGIARLDWGSISLTEVGQLAYSGIGALVIAYLLFYRGVRVLGPTRTAMYGNLQPIIALLFAWMVLHEQPTEWQWIGTGLIMGGLLLARAARTSGGRGDTPPLVSQAAAPFPPVSAPSHTTRL